jgi:hypothetical protein
MGNITKIKIGDMEYDIRDQYLETEVVGKQDKLVSGVNIKTINGHSIIGEGDIDAGFIPLSRDFSDDFNNDFTI